MEAAVNILTTIGLEGLTPEQRQRVAKERLELYKRKRAVITALERLDLVTERGLIEALENILKRRGKL